MLAHFTKVFFQNTFYFWGFIAFGFFIQGLIGGEASVLAPDFLNPAILLFIFVPFVALLLAWDSVRKKEKAQGREQ
jgi:uncharacterized membrane-anchored protein